MVTSDPAFDPFAINGPERSVSDGGELTDPDLISIGPRGNLARTSDMLERGR